MWCDTWHPSTFCTFPSDLLDIRDFSIRRFSETELDLIFSNDVNEVFFPHARIDTGRLESYWFLDVSCTERIVSIWDKVIEMDAPYWLQFGSHPSAVHDALRYLALYDWRGDVWTRTAHPAVPFAIRISDDLTEWPSSPDLSGLQFDWTIDPNTGEDVPKYPADGFDLGADQTEHLRAFLCDACGVVSRLCSRANCGGSLKVSLDFIVKAFSNSPGPEQLLWYLTASDGLLGEKGRRGSNSTDLIAGRLSRILVGDDPGRRNCLKEFKALYDIRSEIVHGRAQQAQVIGSQLVKARAFARSAAVWMLHYLDHLAQQMSQATFDSKGREAFLAALDGEPRPGYVLDPEISSALPTGFPFVPAWVR